jgi:hypothetical protein
MRRLIVIGCIAASCVIGGLLVYGAVMAMYRLARPLALPPAMTNLLPVAILGAMWFVVVRQMKYFQRRAAQREVPLPFTTGIFRSRYTEEQRREYWLNVKAKGKKSGVSTH